MSQAPFPRRDMFCCIICSHIYRFTYKTLIFFFDWPHRNSATALVAENSAAMSCTDGARQAALYRVSSQLASMPRSWDCHAKLTTCNCINQCNAPLHKGKEQKFHSKYGVCQLNTHHREGAIAPSRGMMKKLCTRWQQPHKLCKCIYNTQYAITQWELRQRTPSTWLVMCNITGLFFLQGASATTASTG